MDRMIEMASQGQRLRLQRTVWLNLIHQIACIGEQHLGINSGQAAVALKFPQGIRHLSEHQLRGQHHRSLTELSSPVSRRRVMANQPHHSRGIKNQ